MTVIEIILVFLIIYVLSMLLHIWLNGKPINISDYLELFIDALLTAIIIVILLGIIFAIGYGLWHAPWYNLFHNKLW